MSPAGPDDFSHILAALRRGGVVPDEPGWRVEPVSGGLNSRVYAVRGPDGVLLYTVRQTRATLPHLIEHEERVLRELGAGHLACVPTLVGQLRMANGTDDALLVHRYVPGSPAPLADVSPEARAALGACLAGIHAYRRETYTIWPSLDARAGSRKDLYLDRLRTLEQYVVSGSLAERVRPLTRRIAGAPFEARAGWDERTFALLHGDLSIGNLLWDGDHVTLIDWEYARDGDPAEDLAYLFGEQPLPADPRAEITEAYIAAGGDPSAVARMHRYLPLVILDSALWWADYLAARGLDPTGAPEVQERLARAGELADDSGPHPRPLP